MNGPLFRSFNALYPHSELTEDAAVPILPQQEGVHHLSVRVDLLLGLLVGTPC